MQLLSRFVAAVLLASSMTACASSTATTEMIGQNVDYVRFQSLDGNWHILDEFKGKTVVMIFWASWCSRSRSTISSLNKLAARNAGRNDRVFIAVSIDKAADESKFRDFIKDVPIDAFLHSYSGNDVYDEAFIRMNGSELPHIFIIDPNGNVVAVGHSDKVVYDYLKEMP